jgi:hypothetical protein
MATMTGMTDQDLRAAVLLRRAAKSGSRCARSWQLRKAADTRHSSRYSQTAACGEAKRSPSTGPTLIMTPSCHGYVAPFA